VSLADGSPAGNYFAGSGFFPGDLLSALQPRPVHTVLGPPPPDQLVSSRVDEVDQQRTGLVHVGLQLLPSQYPFAVSTVLEWILMRA